MQEENGKWQIEKKDRMMQELNGKWQMEKKRKETMVGIF